MSEPVPCERLLNQGIPYGNLGGGKPIRNYHN